MTQHWQVQHGERAILSVAAWLEWFESGQTCIKCPKSTSQKHAGKSLVLPQWTRNTATLYKFQKTGCYVHRVLRLQSTECQGQLYTWDSWGLPSTMAVLGQKAELTGKLCFKCCSAWSCFPWSCGKSARNRISRCQEPIIWNNPTTENHTKIDSVTFIA